MIDARILHNFFPVWIISLIQTGNADSESSATFYPRIIHYQVIASYPATARTLQCKESRLNLKKIACWSYNNCVTHLLYKQTNVMPAISHHVLSCTRA